MDRFIEISGVRIRYRQAGAGDPVLLLHGWGGSIESFDPVFRALSGSFAVTSIDFPGHGQSDLPPAAWTVGNFTRATIELMDRLALGPAHIVAHSFGGRVAIKLAAAEPHRVRRMVFTAAAGIAPRASMARSLKKSAASLARSLQTVPAVGSVIKGLKSRLMPRVASRDYLNAGALRETLSLVVAEDLSPMLASIRCPVLLLWGGQDVETPVYMAEMMKERIADSELHVFPSAGHFPYLDESTKFNLYMLKFLRA